MKQTSLLEKKYRLNARDMETGAEEKDTEEHTEEKTNGLEGTRTLPTKFPLMRLKGAMSRKERLAGKNGAIEWWT